MKARAASRWMLVLIALVGSCFASEPDLTGPLSHFWIKVRRDWAQRLPGLNHGSLQTFIWVALVWEGPEALAGPDVERLASVLAQRESRRWVRAQVTRHRWSEIDHRDLSRMQAMRQHLILVGTPEGNNLIARALETTPIRISRGEVVVSGRRLAGDDLLVVAITPNPVSPSHYALIVTGTSDAELLSAPDVPWGDSDYVIYRGRRLVESGFFNWRNGRPDSGASRTQWRFEERFLWTEVASGDLRLRYDPALIKPSLAGQTAIELATVLRETQAFLGVDPARMAPLVVNLYDSVEEKARQTSDSSLARAERSSGAVHLVAGQGFESFGRWAIAQAVIRLAEGVWGHAGESAHPGLAAALALACLDRFEGIPLAAWAARSTRDAGYFPLEVLFSRPAGDLSSGDPWLLDAAAFLRELFVTEGAGKVARFYRTSTRGDLPGSFREHFGSSLRQAEKIWLASLPPLRPLPPLPQMTSPPPAPDAPSTTADAARRHFRAGRFDEAIDAASSVLASEKAPTDERGWAAVTLGRAHAAAGRLVSTASMLRSPDIKAAPAQVQILADYWLSILGQPLNRRRAHMMLRQEAEADLMNWDWEEAERKLRQVLAEDPRSPEGHEALARVYESRYRYWHDFAELDRELFPGVSGADPEMYLYLKQKGDEEMRIAAALPKPAAEAANLPDPPEDDSFTLFLEAKALFHEGKLVQARRRIEAARSTGSLHPDLDAYIHLYLGRIESVIGDAASARSHFETVLSLKANPTVTAEAHSELARLGVGS